MPVPFDVLTRVAWVPRPPVPGSLEQEGPASNPKNTYQIVDGRRWGAGSMDRAAVFVDGAYVQWVTAHRFEYARVDYQKFVAAVLPPDTQLLRAYYYDSLPYVGDPPTEEDTDRLARKERWLHAIEHIPQLEVRLGQVARREDGTVVQKRVDVLLAMDMVRVAYKRLADVVVLVAGDSDYVPLVEEVKAEGLLVDLVYSEGSVHGDLVRACDRRRAINWELVEDVRMQSGLGTLGNRVRRG